MPRIDETDQEERDLLEDCDVDVEQFVELGSPVDVCYRCYRSYGFTSMAAHPPYGEFEEDTCAICADILDEEYDD